MIARFVTFDRAERYLQLGWLPSTALAGTHHGEWSCLMVWICQCKCIEPNGDDLLAGRLHDGSSRMMKAQLWGGSKRKPGPKGARVDPRAAVAL